MRHFSPEYPLTRHSTHRMNPPAPITTHRAAPASQPMIGIEPEDRQNDLREYPHDDPCDTEHDRLRRVPADDVVRLLDQKEDDSRQRWDEIS